MLYCHHAAPLNHKQREFQNIPLSSKWLSSRETSFCHFLSGKGRFVFLLGFLFFSSPFSWDRRTLPGFFNLWKGWVGASSFGRASESSSLVVGRPCAASAIALAAFATLSEAKSSFSSFFEDMWCRWDGPGSWRRRSKPFSLWKGVKIPFRTNSSLS